MSENQFHSLPSTGHSGSADHNSAGVANLSKLSQIFTC